MTERTCAGCDTAMTGRKRKYCTKLCMKRASDQRRRLPERPCHYCEQMFRPWRQSSPGPIYGAYCSPACRGLGQRQGPKPERPPPVTCKRVYVIDCRICIEPFVSGRPYAVLCRNPRCKAEDGRRSSLACYHRRYAVNGRVPDSFLHNAHVRRQRLLRNGPIEDGITIAWLLKRDRGICQLCRKPTRAGRHKPTIDHTIPVSLGGTHTKANVQLACWACNSAKGNRAQGQGEQLRLVG